MSDMQISVRFRRKTSMDTGVETSVFIVLIDSCADKVSAGFFFFVQSAHVCLIKNRILITITDYYEKVYLIKKRNLVKSNVRYGGDTRCDNCG